jgi:hypothetical protein
MAKEITKEEALNKIKEEADKHLQLVSTEISGILQKYGYQLTIQQSIVLKKILPEA